MKRSAWQWLAGRDQRPWYRSPAGFIVMSLVIALWVVGMNLVFDKVWGARATPATDRAAECAGEHHPRM